MVDDTNEPRGIAQHLQAALVGAHDNLADRLDARKRAHVTSVLEQFESDLAPMLAPMVAELLDNPGTPDHLKDLLRQVGAPEHFSSSLLIGVAVGAIIGPVLGSAVEPYVQNISNAAWSLNPSRPLSPDLLAAAVLKGVYTEAEAAPIAKQSGYSDGAFSRMVLTAGQSLGLAEALLLERRDQLVGVTLDDVLRYSNMNPKFYASAANLKYIPPSVGEVITGALKGHLTDAQAIPMIGHAGLDPVNYPWLKASAGRPFSPLEGIDLLNRGEITEARVREAIAQSDINTDYTDDILKLRVQYPPPRSVVPMFRSGSITEAQARQLLGYHGYPTWIQDAFIHEATTTKAGAVKELTQAQIVASYEARLMDAPTALFRLAAVGYSAPDAQALLDLADEKRTLNMHNAVIRMIGARYVGRRITLPEATVALNAIPVPTIAQHDLIALWDIERQANVHVATPAMVIGAYRRKEIDATETKTRLIALGVHQDDLAIFVADGFPPTKPQPALVAAVVNA